MPKDWLFPVLAGWGVIGSFFAIRRSLRRLASLPGPRRILTRNMMVSSFVGTLAVSLAGLAYIIWSSTGDRLAYMAGVFALEVFLTCGFVCARLYVRLKQMVSEQ
jgi:hypothetical protein